MSPATSSGSGSLPGQLTGPPVGGLAQPRAPLADEPRGQVVLDLALGAAQIGVFDIDLVAGTRTWDERLQAIFGYAAADFDPTFTPGVDERLHPEDRTRVAAALARAIDTCGTYEEEYRVVWPDGTVRWAVARGRALCDEDGRTVRVLGAVHDVTALRAGQERTDAILESMAVGYLAMDSSWTMTYANAEAERITGTSRAELVGRDFWATFPATVGSEFELGYRRAVATGEVVSFDAFYPEPLDVWIEVRAVPEHGGLNLYFLDITDRRATQQARELAAERLAALGSIALALTDADTVDDLTAIVAEQGFAALGCDGGSIAVPDLDDPDVMRSYITESYGEVTRAGYSRLHRGEPLPLCVAATTGRRALYPDRAACLALSDQMVDVMAVTGSQAFASIPLRAGGEVIGVLTAGWAAPQPFDDEQLELLETLAAQCAQALQRLAARDAEREAARAATEAAAQHATLVLIAQALADAATESDVLAVVAAQGSDLLAANGAGLCLLEPGGQQVRTLVTDSYSDVRAEVQLTPADFPLPAIHSAATGATHFLSDREQTEALFPGSREIYAGAGVQASAGVPLHARGRLLGCLSIGFSDSRAWPRHERDLLEAFASMTAQALDRISAHEAERAANRAVARFSETLQRSLLTAPPEPDHLQIAVRYVPAAAEAQVGGDWYDAFVLEDGATSLVIGDVSGHDRTAAAAMGQMRNLLRGIGYTVGEPPALVLSALDRALRALDVDALATIVLAQVEQDAGHRAAGTRLLRWSNAGHPPPLLLTPGEGTRFLDGGAQGADLLVGLDPSTPRVDHEVVLQPGSTLLFFTDGLVERRDASLDEGQAWLAATVTALADRALDELCDELLALVGDRAEDDVALLAVRAHPEDRPRPAEAGPSTHPAPTPA